MNEDITCQEVKNRISKGEKLNFIDVREEWEHEEENIGARLIPLGDLPARINEIKDLQTEEVIIHCKSGSRAGRAKKFLITQGFQNVRNMDGGIIAYLEL